MFLQNIISKWQAKPACFLLASYLAYFSTLKMGVIYSSETLVDFY
jgi:hypothetical protein